MAIEKADIIRVMNKVEYVADADIRFESITLQNIMDGASFNTPEELEQFKVFLAQGHKGYYAYYKGECALRTWIFFSKDTARVGANFIYDLPANQAFSGWSMTNPQFYRLGIFTKALIYAINDNPDYTIAGYVDSDNIASLKGCYKAGFKTTERYTLYLLLGRGFKIKTYHYLAGKVFNFSLGRIIHPSK